MENPHYTNRPSNSILREMTHSERGERMAKEVEIATIHYNGKSYWPGVNLLKNTIKEGESFTAILVDGREIQYTMLAGREFCLLHTFIQVRIQIDGRFFLSTIDQMHDLFEETYVFYFYPEEDVLKSTIIDSGNQEG